MTIRCKAPLQLFLATAFLEMGMGLVLLFVPAVAVALLLGVGEAAPESLLIARVAGVALLAIGVASWMTRSSEHCAAQFGLLVGILIYDGGAAVLLAYAGLCLGMVGAALWPAIVIHFALSVWCMRSLASKPSAGK